MRPRFQADADLNHRIVIGLRRREPSIDFLSARDGQIIGIDDLEVLDASARSGRILISHDRKTMIHYFAQFIVMRSSPGLIIVAQDLEIGLAIEELLLIWATTDASEWTGQIAFLPI